MANSAGHTFGLMLFCTFAFLPGTPINKPPVLGYKDLNLFKLFRLVYIHGGCDNVSVLSVPTICLLYSASGKWDLAKNMKRKWALIEFMKFTELDWVEKLLVYQMHVLWMLLRLIIFGSLDWW